MKYAQKYSTDDLFDMFASQANMVQLALQDPATIAQQLSELASDMEDNVEVANIVKARARTIALNHRFGADRESAW